MSLNLLKLPDGTEPVTNADEEIFLVYTALNQKPLGLTGPDGFRGLGHVDSRKDILSIRFELTAPSPPSKPTDDKPASRSRKDKSAKKSRGVNEAPHTVEIELAQDKTALRSRKGDTGSVLWRASIAFAQVILQQHRFPPSNMLLDKDRLRNSHILELGAGTGLLSIALSACVKSYTATDIAPLLPLIRKNITLNFAGWTQNTKLSEGLPGSNIAVEELDWETLLSLPPKGRSCYYPKPPEPNTEWDLVLIVDCIYHPSLLPALAETIETVSTAGKTWVLVIVELRQEDVVREFLERLLDKGTWRLFRVDGLLDLPYVIWASQKYL
ncbi:putative methyltransferase-domain-containing protein [Suillus paluster]|uniref:putative methyltransferase-domain-containing protein n=1 Tax=Suillus paluster TaxID=48578 RepID=UPI001B87295E|nr:putative methyltransferase-domain-containing protein [Suillus paluster]KAG1728148.1 putative methyltransferase-domain-containing protein [Suillus paluster]